MTILSFSAFFVGLFHSLSPGHWLPVVLMVKTRRWPISTAVLGAAVAASGHVLVSVSLGLFSVWAGTHVLAHWEERLEHFGGILMVAFGLFYAGLSYFRHASCHGHGHHGPVPHQKKAPFLFLFSLGLSPCVAAVPIFLAASGHGLGSVAVSMAAFSLGVLSALVGGTVLVSRGLLKLDHPILDHYGDVLTGLSVALMGALIFVLPVH